MMSEPKNENLPSAVDLDWLAFCYVADELSVQQRDAFEDLMAEEQAARDAVVRAMELAGDIYHSELESGVAVSKPLHESEGRRNWKWQTAIAVLIGASLGAWLWSTADRDGGAVAETSSEELAIAWVDSLEENELQELETEVGDELGLEDDSTSEWMLAAIGELDESELEATN